MNNNTNHTSSHNHHNNTNNNVTRPMTPQGRPGQPPPKFREPPQPARLLHNHHPHQKPPVHQLHQKQPHQQPPSGSHTFHKASNAYAKAHVAEPYTPEEEQRIQKSLNKVLGPEYVSFRPGGGGQNVSYIEGWKALNLANEVFGFNGWSSQVISVQVDFMDLLGAGRVSLGLSVVVRITIRDGTFHEDIGYGFIENAKGKAVAFEKCKKEAFTDGLKRCLRCFGNVLGNCLYDKGIVAKMQKVKLPVPELQSEDFHRDPLVVKRETERTMKAMQKSRELEAQNALPSGNGTINGNGNGSGNGSGDGNGNESVGGANGAIKNEAGNDGVNGNDVEERESLISRAVKDYDLDDFDESFEFSDDLPADGEEPGETLHELDVELAEAQRGSFEKNKTEDKQATPEQVFFTSSKKAMDVQKDPEQNNVPVFDHKFIANSVRRTVDPNKSQKIRRPDVPVSHNPSQINSSSTGSPGLMPGPNGIGKRPLGMPPSQRQQPKRLHKDVDAMDVKN